MRIELKTFILLIFLLIFSTEFSKAQVQSNKLKKVKLQLKWKHQFQFAGYYAAIEKGYYKNAGIEVELIEAKENEEPADAVFDGKAEFGVGTSDIVLYKAKGKAPVILSTIFQHSPQVLLASKKSGIEHIHNLVGKRIMVEPHSADVITFMADEGVSISKNTVYPHTFIVQQLIDGEVDALTAYMTDEPFVLEKANFDYTIISPLSGGIDFYGDLLFTTEKQINDNPELVEKFRLASLKGWNYAMKNTDEIVNLIYNKYSTRHSKEHLTYEATQMQRFIIPEVVEIGYTNKGRWQTIINTYKKMGLLTAEINIDGLLYNDYMNSKAKLPIGLILLLVGGFVIVSIIAFMFYKMNLKLKNEIQIQIMTNDKLIISEEKYRLLTENMKDVVWILDPHTLLYRYISPSIEQLRGYTAEEVMAEPLDFALTPPAKEQVRKLLSDGAKNFKNDPNKFIIETLEQSRKDGTTVWTEVIARFFVNPKTNNIEYIGVTRDITERKKAEFEIQKLSRATEQSPASIVITNLKGEIEYINPKFTEVTGYTKEEAMGNNPSILKSENTKSETYKNLWQSITNGKEWKGEFENVRKNGEIYYESAVISPILDDHGHATHYIAVKEDITDKKKILEQLKELNSTKDKFFSIIAHDLKNPLGSFRQLTALLHDTYDDFEQSERMEFLEVLKNSANSLYLLLENLLEWSKTQRGTINFNPSKVELQTISKDTIHLLKLSADHKHINIIDKINSDIIAYCDPNLITTVIRNLISNAIKFTPIYGNIEIGSFTNTSDNNIHIYVKDSGVGMTKDTISKLFRIDVNVTTHGTEDERGSGLGLILCKEFIDLHKGRIWVESEDGKGSTFWFSLPEFKNDNFINKSN